MKYTIGIDLGATNIKSALINLNGKILKKNEMPTEAEKGAKKVIENIISSIEKVKSGKINGIGIGSPGPLDCKKGVILNPVNLPFRNVPLKKILQKKFQIKVFFDNDTNCFALGEAIFGQGKKYENVLGITLGTGIGAGLVINKKIYHGRNNAAELGHATIKYDGIKSNCGNNGCIEEYISARGIKALFNNKNIEPYSIYNLAKKGNKKAIMAFKKMGYYLGIALANTIYAFDPDIIIIGGKISNSWEFFSESMERTVKEKYFAKPCKIVKSKLKDAGILGAGALIQNEDSAH
ncbi:ROK family protein [Candidatus Woesearchaeota archaeon]|nr:ROK family protein [Candidatus Woesearchaeota archaeon]